MGDKVKSFDRSNTNTTNSQVKNSKGEMYSAGPTDKVDDYTKRKPIKAQVIAKLVPVMQQQVTIKESGAFNGKQRIAYLDSKIKE